MRGGQVLLFRAGGLRLGVFLAEVGRLLVEDALIAVPFAHPAMAGLLVAGEDGPVPVFDLRGLVDDTASWASTTTSATSAPPRPAITAVVGATVALFPTAKGPVGLRLEQLLGTIATYEPLDAAATARLHEDVPAALARTVTGAASATDGPFSFFSPEAFLAGVGL
jgi:hypothetical protein